MRLLTYLIPLGIIGVVVLSMLEDHLRYKWARHEVKRWKDEAEGIGNEKE